jgi:hypothetical protein
MRAHLMSAIAGVIATFVVSPVMGAAITGAYHLTLCGGTQQPSCNVQTPAITPSDSDVSKLDGAVQNFYSQISQGKHVEAHITGANASGYIWGSAFGQTSGIATYFIYKDGSVLCCTADTPFNIMGINNNGIVIGDNTFAYVSDSFNHGNPVFKTVDFDDESEAFLDGVYGNWMGLFQPFAARFLAIDDDNRIRGGAAAFGSFILEPTIPSAPSSVSEPSSLALLATATGLALGNGAFLIQTRRRWFRDGRSHRRLPFAA